MPHYLENEFRMDAVVLAADETVEVILPGRPSVIVTGNGMVWNQAPGGNTPLTPEGE